MMLVLIWMDYREARETESQTESQTDRLGGNGELLLVEEAATGAYYPHSFIHSTRLFELIA